MKKKQLIGIIVTGVVIIAIGVTGILSNIVAGYFSRDMEDSSMLRDFFSNHDDFTQELPADDFIGVLNIVGEIGPVSSASLTSSDAYNHNMYLDYIEEMEHSDANKGILLYVDSPGGTVYEADELYLKLMEYKKETNRPIWAYFASEACSGGYYIAMAADQIYANRNCWTGSIGVIVSLVNCKDLYDKLGIKEIDITSGKNKSMGSAGLDLTEEQRDILQSLVDETYDQFVGVVCEGRGMEESSVRALADGRIYSAEQALKVGLIDKISPLEKAKQEFADTFDAGGEIQFYAPESDVMSFWTSLLSGIENLMPKSDTELAADIVENKGNGVLKYYAK